MMAGNAGSLPTAGLVFYASFRDGLIAETGQHLFGNGKIITDEMLGRSVLSLDKSVVTFSAAGFPVGNEPFTVAAKMRVLFGRFGYFLFGWGSTPWTPTVAGLSCDSHTTHLTNWGWGLECGIGNPSGLAKQ